MPPHQLAMLKKEPNVTKPGLACRQTLVNIFYPLIFLGCVWFVVGFICLVLGFWGFWLPDNWFLRFIGFLGVCTNEWCITQLHVIVVILCAFHTCLAFHTYLVVMMPGVDYDSVVGRRRDGLLDAARMCGEVGMMWGKKPEKTLKNPKY